jgi:putative ABC transport system substrate-binding protein
MALPCWLLILLAFGIVVVPVSAGAQSQEKIPRIGVLTGGALTPGGTRRDAAFRQALRDLGYVEEQNITLEYRYAEGQFARLPALAVELVRLNIDVLVASGSEGVAAAKLATQTIPIVMRNVGDPVQRGFVESLARPGGNITGVSNMSDDVIGKQLELLKEVVPHLSRVAALWNPPQPAHTPLLKTLEGMARTVGVHLQPVAVHRPEDFEGAFATMRAERADALIIFGSALHFLHARRIAALALTHQLPAITGEGTFAEGELLMTYGPDDLAIFRRLAYYVDRILKGAKPADLPVEQPTRFELVVNLKTAQTLGLTIPPTVLFQADEVIK